MRRNCVLLLLLATLAGCSLSTQLPDDLKNRTPDKAPVEDAKPGAWDRAQPTREGSDWPKFLGPTGDSVSSEKGILTQWPRGGLKKLWECALGAGYAPPSIVNGKLYHVDAFGGTARLTCRNAETGEFIWKHDYAFSYQDLYGYDDGPRCCPVIAEDRVYTYGVEGMLHCVDAKTGTDIWKLDTKSKYYFHQNFFGVGSTPFLEGELLLAAVGGSEKGPRPPDLRQAKPNGTAIVGIDAKTGQIKYAAGDELASYSSPCVATIHQRRVGLYLGRTGLIAFDPTTGNTLFTHPWRAKIEESVNAVNPVVVEDKILLTECYGPGSVCLKVKPDLSGVTEVWTDKEKDRDDRSLACHWNTPIYHEGYVYGSSGRHTEEGDIRCISLASGEVEWREKRTKRCTLLKIDGHALSLGEYGEIRLFKLDPKKFDEVARWEINEDLVHPAWAPPVVSRGLLYVRGKTKLVCYELVPKK
jgi:outer membrane protein assembly factor BamB